MSASKLFYPHAVVLPGGTITQLLDLAPGHNFMDLLGVASGQPSSQWSGALGAAPVVPFRTRQIKSVLDLMLTVSACEGVAYNGMAGNTDIYFKKGAAYQLRTADAATDHLRIRIEGGSAGGQMTTWNSIRASQGAAASIDAVIIPVWDGVNDPMIASLAALSGTSAADELFTLGPISVNTVELLGVQTANIMTNVVPETQFDAGQPFTTYTGVRFYRYVVEIDCRNAEYLVTYGTRGTALTAFSMYLRRMQGSQFAYANNQTQHIKAEATTGTIKARQLQTSGMTRVTIEINKPAATLGSAGITWTTGVAIT